MDGIDGLFNAIEAGDLDAVHALTLSVLSACSQTDADSTDAVAALELVFEACETLIGAGRTEDGTAVYRAAIDRLTALGATSSFEAAWLLDRLAGQLSAAGDLDRAISAARDSVSLTSTIPEIDGPARIGRLKRLGKLQIARGDEPSAEAAFAECGRLERLLGLREMSPTVDLQQALEKAGASLDGVDLADSVKHGKVPVHFATHRKPLLDNQTGFTDPYAGYGYERSSELNYGRAIITVPGSRGVGSYAEPTAAMIANGSVPRNAFVVSSIDVLGTAGGLYAEVGALLGQSGKGELLVFVHGFNTSLASGLMRAAQLKIDMKIDGAVVLYSLPSMASQKRRGYEYDHEQAIDSNGHVQLAKFLIELAAEARATRIHLVGHSMGCEVLVKALFEISKLHKDALVRPFNEIVFAAPDVNQANFKSLLPHVAVQADRVTVYASPKDGPLYLSSYLRGRPRAGQDAKALAGISRVDAIDTSEVRSWFSSLWGNLGHWDFIDEAIDDVRAIVWLSLLADARRSQISERMGLDGTRYWAIVALEQSKRDYFSRALGLSRKHGITGAMEMVAGFLAVERELDKPQPNQIGQWEQILAELKLFESFKLVQQPSC